MTSTLGQVVLVAIVGLAVLWAFQRHLLYIPFGKVASPASVGLLQVEEVSFRTEDGLTLAGWFVPAKSRRPPFTILVFNGNAGNRSLRAPLALALAEAGLAVLLFDYRGYGENAGRPSEAGLVADGRAARAYLEQRRDVDPRRIVYFGESLGTGVAVALALERPPAALILRSPFASMSELGQYHYPFLPVRLLLSDRYPSIERIGQIRRPLLVIAGDRDSIVPPQQSRRLFNAALEPKELAMVPGADHNDYALLAGDLLIEKVVRFVAAIAGVKIMEQEVGKNA
jgi:fermentation-respiration switch protein FrsA (DUF1100 family)